MSVSTDLLQLPGAQHSAEPFPLCFGAVARQSSRIPVYFLYGEAPRPITGQVLHIETIEARSARHQWKIEPHLHQSLHQLMLVLDGRGVVLAEGARSQYRPPALLLMPAGSVHGFEFEPGTTGHVVSLSVELVRELGNRDARIGTLFARPTTVGLDQKALRATDLARSVRLLEREFARTGTGHQLSLYGWVEVLLGNALRLTGGLADPAAPAVGGRRLLITRFNALVERRFRDDQGVAEYARALHVSESRLRNATLAVTGQTPLQLIHARILLEAKRQLHYTDSPIGEIAWTLGFEDPAYFTRFFARRTGMSPRAFRRKGPERALAVD
jgi:AraC family transcriptional activator of pobA